MPKRVHDGVLVTCGEQEHPRVHGEAPGLHNFQRPLQNQHSAKHVTFG